jgi:serine/threonine protein kinase
MRSWGPAMGMSPSPEEANGALLENGHAFRFGNVRYTLSNEVGRGAHCVVWRCVRVSKQGNPREFALKVHNEEKSAFKREAAALEALGSAEGAELFPRMLGTVQLLGRTGLAMPLYGPDLYQLQKQYQRQPFPLPFVYTAATQLLRALEALCSAGLVHADIKPQNLVVERADAALDEHSRLTLIDLGSCLSHDQLTSRNRRITYVQSRWYRAPEVLLWAPMGHAADVWSVGCVIAEAALGVPLFPGESEHNQVARIDRVLGPPPPSLLARSRRSEHFFRLRGGEALLRTDKAHTEPKLVRYLPSDDLEELLTQVLSPHGLTEEAKASLLCLLGGLLQWEPHARWESSRMLDKLREELGELGCSWPPD